MRSRLAIAVAGVLLFVGCGSSNSAAPSTTSTAPSSIESSSPASDSEFCSIFANLSQTRDQGMSAKDQAGWDKNLETVQHIAAVAPGEIKAQADAYVQMVKDRAELAAANGYAAVADLPADARDAFIARHKDLQVQVNQLIAYAKSNCNGVS
jgi:hypothetical protein